ncbi:hypothetical protein [Metamycoplasma equirhinis]|uniref:hypothetical protein n=1 Tax=Metamycoplasma equirhinis TaxID=92402 RepID=UPI0035933725
MKLRIWKVILSVFILLGIGVSILLALIIKLGNQYRPSIYNYESYLAPSIIKKLKQKYNYKEFKEINEFTQALTQEKAIAGVGSDFQAAQLIINQKIQKIDFEKVFGKGIKNVDGTLSWEKLKKFYTPAVSKHLEAFDSLILSTLTKYENEGNLKKYKYYLIKDSDNKPIGYTTKANSLVSDHFYEYVLPYFVQDKGIAYNINKDTRPDLNIKLANQELNDKNLKLSWEEIFTFLRKANYTHFGWTNAFVDNLMIGAMTSGANWEDKFTKVNNGTRIFDFNDANYKLAINSFVQFIENATNKSIKETKFNYLSGDGLDLLNHLIEPKSGRSDAAVMYNGDAIDAYYSKDNFSGVKEGKIRFIRPKDNYILMDNWIISKGLSEKDTAEFLKTLGESLYRKWKLEDIETNNSKEFTSKLTSNFFSEFVETLENGKINEHKTILTEHINQLSKMELEKLRGVFEKTNLSNHFASWKIPSILNESTSLDFKKWIINMFDNFINKAGQAENYEWLLVIRNYFSDLNIVLSDEIDDFFAESSIGEIKNFDYVSYTPAINYTFEFILNWYFRGDEISMSIFRQPEPDPVKNPTYKLYTYPIIDNNLRTKINTYFYEATKS